MLGKCVLSDVCVSDVCRESVCVFKICEVMYGSEACVF